MKVLIAASECSPLVKVGGIADVIGSLPIALRQLGVDARVVIPYYKPLLDKVKSDNSIMVKELIRMNVPYQSKDNPVVIFETTIPHTDVVVYLIHNDTWLSNGGVYYSPDAMPSTDEELDRFAFFSRAVSDAFTYSNSIYHPDIIHCNDWHTGLLPQILKTSHRHSTTGLPKTVFTIHNLGYQGFSKTDVADKLGDEFKTSQLVKWDTQDDNLDFVLQGIIGADFITTVSPHYAEEIQTEEYGEGMHEILQSRAGRLYGILNGISYEVFDPLTDSMIYANFGKTNWKTEKIKNKVAFQKEMGLELNPNKPIVGVISRLAHQKGLDLVVSAVPEIIQMGYQFVILGTGDPYLEANFAQYNSDYIGNYKANILFSEELARKIYASCDMFLVPSRYEPCGLTQMIAMRYGSVPVVRATGGLFDTVHNNETGFTFEEFNTSSMIESLKRAIVMYVNHKPQWEDLVNNCLTQDFSWKQSAQKYVVIYKKALEG